MKELLLGGNDDMPAWLRGVYRYGVPSVIALFLVYSMNKTVASDIATIHEELNQHIAEQRFYLRAICLNTAKDEAGRALCVPPQGLDRNN